MRLACYPLTSAMNNGVPVFDHFMQGVVSSGDNIVIYNNSQINETVDAAVIWSVLWTKPNRKIIWDGYRSLNKPIIVLEVGGLKRNITWKVGLNGINRDANFGNQDCSSDRWKQFGLDLQPWNPKSHIVVCGQHKQSQQWDDLHWIDNTIQEIRSHTDRPIIYRPHPRFLGDVPAGVPINQPKLSGNYDEFDFNTVIETAWAVVNHSSNPGSQAIINGIPAITSEHSLAWPMSTRIENIETPNMLDREQWAYDLAYTEWTVDELKDGMPWRRIRRFI